MNEPNFKLLYFLKNLILRIFFVVFMKENFSIIRRVKSAAFKSYYFPNSTSHFDPDLIIKCRHNLTVGKNCILSKCLIGAHSKVKIGNNVTISRGAIIETGRLTKSGSGRHASKPIVIGNNVWIATNAIILGGVKIGDGALIGAGSVVRRNIKKNEIFKD